MNFANFILAFLLIALVVTSLYLLLYYKFSPEIQSRNDALAKKLSNSALQKLINGSDINNIPKLNIITSNDAVKVANQCATNPIFIKEGSDSDCVAVCENSSATAIEVDSGEIYTYNNTVLPVGVSCIIGDRPDCNMNTSIAIMTVNSVVCDSKYPALVGGTTGTTVLACNDGNIQSHKNVLWDYKENERFDPTLTEFNDADELLDDGNFRFRCKFEGEDINLNQYQQHPLERLHPIRNYCASLIYAAHPNVKTIYDDDGKFKCDCGDPEETRVYHLIENDETSMCTDKPITGNDNDDGRIKIPYNCYTINSPITDITQSVPCPPELFVKQGSKQAYIEFDYCKQDNKLFEHPAYHDFPNHGYYGIKKDRE